MFCKPQCFKNLTILLTQVNKKLVGTFFVVLSEQLLTGHQMFRTKQRLQTIICTYVFTLFAHFQCYFLQLNCPFYVTQYAEQSRRVQGESLLTQKMKHLSCFRN